MFDVKPDYTEVMMKVEFTSRKINLISQSHWEIPHHNFLAVMSVFIH